MTTDAIFGPITGTPQVELAVLRTLETWVPYTLRALERRLNLPPHTLPDPRAYTGGIDFDSWDGHHLPAIIATVKPTGEADRSTNGYNQWYEIEAAPIVITETEDESRTIAGHLATAIVVTLTQHGDLGGIASETTLISAPVPELPDPDKRRLARARTTLRAYVTGLVDPLAGPHTTTPPDSPQHPTDPDDQWDDWPAHTSTHIDAEITT